MQRAWVGGGVIAVLVLAGTGWAQGGAGWRNHTCSGANGHPEGDYVDESGQVHHVELSDSYTFDGPGGSPVLHHNGGFSETHCSFGSCTTTDGQEGNSGAGHTYGGYSHSGWDNDWDHSNQRAHELLGMCPDDPE